MKISRNAPCRCGSGKKYKNCHWDSDQGVPLQNNSSKSNFDEYLIDKGVPNISKFDEKDKKRLTKILKDKENNIRAQPSTHFIDNSNLLNAEKRKSIIDLAAKYVDENWCGRSEMCQQFAMLVKYLLTYEGVNSKIFEGEAKYFKEEIKFGWPHYWIIIENEEIIDCNIDSLPENPYGPEGLEPYNYWGLIKEIPTDRQFYPIKEFTEQDEINLEKRDNETIIWKNKSIDEYKKICK